MKAREGVVSTPDLFFEHTRDMKCHARLPSPLLSLHMLRLLSAEARDEMISWHALRGRAISFRPARRGSRHKRDGGDFLDSFIFRSRHYRLSRGHQVAASLKIGRRAA